MVILRIWHTIPPTSISLIMARSSAGGQRMARGEVGGIPKTKPIRAADPRPAHTDGALGTYGTADNFHDVGDE